VKERKKLKIFWKYLKRTLLVVFSFLVLLIIAALIIAYFYEDRVKKFVVDNINKQLNSEIQVKDIELSLLKKFPDATLIFKEVTAKDAIKATNKGNLLKAEEVLLNFNVWDIFDGNYRIKKIEVDRGFLNLLVYGDGSDNYHFWKEDTTSTKDDSFGFDLQKLILNDLNIHYLNFPANQDYSGIAKDMIIKGKFNNDKYALNIYGSLLVNKFNVSGVSYFPGKLADIDMSLNVDNATGTYKFDEGKIDVGEMHFDVGGVVVYNDNKETLNLDIKGNDFKLQALLNEVPSAYQKYIKDYKGVGDFDFHASLVGSYKGNDLPSVTINFGIRNGKLEQRSSDLALENVNLNAVYSNGAEHNQGSSKLRIKDFSAKLKSGMFRGELTINDFNKPTVELILYAKTDLKVITDFIKVDTLKSITGNIDLKMSFKGKLNEGNSFTAQDFLDSKTSGTVKFTGVNFSIKNDPHEYKNINAECEFSNNDIIVNKLTGNLSSSDFSVKGYFRNVLSYLFLKDQNLLIDGNVTSVNTDLDELLTYSSGSSDTAYRLVFPKNISWKVKLSVAKLNFKKFNASNLSAEIKLKNQLLNANNVSFNSQEGSTKAFIIIDGSQKDKLLISCDAQITKVNISKLFYEFGNFGQESMKDENLKGLVNADIKFAGVWSAQLEPDMEKMYAKVDLKIENGELVNYAPMKGLSKFLKVSDLNDVKFATLHNQIEVKNRTIYIPAMEIKSTAMNIIVSGEHTFDNVIKYNIKLQLSEILSKKARAAKPENEEFGVVEDDGLGKTSLFILITGTVDNPVYKYDAKGVKEKIVVGFIKEKATLKSILNEEFGWFKKDTTIKKSDKKSPELKPKPKDKDKENLKKQEDGKFVIEWDEGDK
jgi:hypothetical protein